MRGVPEALDATVTMAPRLRGTIRLTAARDSRKTPLTLTSKVWSQSSSLNSRTSPSRRMPAVLTR